MGRSSVVAERHPFVEPPFACSHQRDPLGRLTDYGQRMHDALTHWDLANGYTVSVLDVERATGGPPVFETWAWPTARGAAHALTSLPGFHDDEVAALEYREGVAALPSDDFRREVVRNLAGVGDGDR